MDHIPPVLALLKNFREIILLKTTHLDHVLVKSSHFTDDTSVMNFGKKFAIWFSENEGRDQRQFATFQKIHPFWRCGASLTLVSKIFHWRNRDYYLGPGGNENDPGGGDWVGGACHCHNFLHKYIFMLGREGIQKRNGKSVVFCQTSLGPPPVWSFFTNKKLNHNFFLEFLVNHQCGDSPHFLRDFFIETFPNHI